MPAVLLVWPPGCALPGCKHHYRPGRNLAAEGCTCPGWFDSGGWHLLGSDPGCVSPAHRPAHQVFPLDAYESEWRCRTCAAEFTSDSGWATCPRDPDPPRQITDVPLPATPRSCPDGGACHHGCTRGCFRVVYASPLSAAGWGDTWPEEIRQAYGDQDGAL